MKLNIKKSKIIVPALGLLLLSTAASVSGTVAWFTANRTYSMHAGNFAVVNTKDNLSCTLGNGIQTTADNSANTITVNANSKLFDASLDHTADTNDIIAPNADGDKVGSVTALGSATGGTSGNMCRGKIGNTSDYGYTAFTWTMQFTITFASGNEDLGLFLDLTKSKVTTDGTNAPTNSGKGFRLAFIPTTIPSGSTGVKRIWADNQHNDTGASPVTRISHVDGLAVGADLAATAVAAPIYIDDTMDGTTSAAKGLLPANGTVTSAAMGTDYANYLGTFKYAENTSVAITYTVVAYFEGTDPTVVNDATPGYYETVQADLAFEVRSCKAA